MNTINLRAHYDGEKILLDEPFNLEPDTKLIVTVLPKHTDEEREEWILLSKKGLENAYGKDEPEYSMDLIKEANPD
jgi:hypothetical protein